MLTSLFTKVIIKKILIKSVDFNLFGLTATYTLIYELYDPRKNNLGETRADIAK